MCTDFDGRDFRWRIDERRYAIGRRTTYAIATATVFRGGKLKCFNFHPAHAANGLCARGITSYAGGEFITNSRRFPRRPCIAPTRWDPLRDFLPLLLLRFFPFRFSFDGFTPPGANQRDPDENPLNGRKTKTPRRDVCF